MKPLLNLLHEAAEDPSVVSIKITLYRVADKSKIIDYLIEAAENGKEVVVAVELRARFDEANNIEMSRRLEEAGCRIIYGLGDYKVHSLLLATLKMVFLTLPKLEQEITTKKRLSFTLTFPLLHLTDALEKIRQKYSAPCCWEKLFLHRNVSL